MSAGEAEQADRGSGTTDLGDAVAQAGVVCESIVEDLEVKRRNFEELELHVGDDTVLATNTSGLPITRIAANLRRPERAADSPFLEPAAPDAAGRAGQGERTSDGTSADAACCVGPAGQPRRPGATTSPASSAIDSSTRVYREAFHMVQEGIASVEDVDTAIKYGPGLRFPVYGLIEHADMVGLDMMDAIDSYLFADLAADRTTPPVVRDRIAKGDLGVKSGRGFFDWTDERAAAVRAVRDRFLLDRLKERRAARSAQGLT